MQGNAIRAGMVVLLLSVAATAVESDSRTFLVHLGPLTLKPAGFVDAITDTRDAATRDSISTGYGSFPVTEKPGQTVGSLRNSRLALKGDLSFHDVKFTAYLESD